MALGQQYLLSVPVLELAICKPVGSKSQDCNSGSVAVEKTCNVSAAVCTMLVIVSRNNLWQHQQQVPLLAEVKASIYCTITGVPPHPHPVYQYKI